MSYEGYEQLLCPQGHYWSVDAMQAQMEDEDKLYTCPECQQKAIWWNPVNETNGCDCFDHTQTGELRHPETCCCGHVILEEAAKAVFETCPTCGHSTEKEVRRYKIPLNKGKMINRKERTDGRFGREDGGGEAGVQVGG